MKRLAEVKDSLDIEVKQNFIDPLQNLCDKDLKEIQVNATMFFPPLVSGLPWLLAHVTACSVTVGTKDSCRYWLCSPALRLLFLSRFPSISSLLSTTAATAPEQLLRLDAGLNASSFTVFYEGCRGITSQHAFQAC